MTYLYLLLSLVVVDLLAAISPGPNFVLVTQTAVNRTRRHAISVVLGLVTSNLIWCAAVALGLSTLFELAPRLYGVIRFCGGAYLVYLGVCLWRSNNAAASTQAASSFRGSFSAAYLRGLLTNLSNPKSVVYFGSIFALFMKPSTPAWVQAAAVGIVIFDTVLWYGTVAAVFSSTVIQELYVRIKRPINRIAGVAMIGFGARLMLVRDRI